MLWDVVGRAPGAMHPGADVAGRIRRLPGGVALNIAVALRRFGLTPRLLSAVGQDPEGAALIDACTALGLDMRGVQRPADLPTDSYMAIESSTGLVAAIADAHSLEAVGAGILAPLIDGTIADAKAPYGGTVAVDGNLTAALLGELAAGALLASADLRIAPASPGKAVRLRPFVTAGRGTLYVNVEEAGLLCDDVFADSALAADALCRAGAARVVVTHGPRTATFADGAHAVSADPPVIEERRVTGAGDTFMAAHIAAELSGAGPAAALGRALDAAARFVSGHDPW